MKLVQTHEEKFIEMTTHPVSRLVNKLAVPSIVSMLITSLYNMVDSFFVGQMGTSETAAVGVVYSLMTVIQALGFFLGHGSGNYISRKLGSKETDDAARMASVGLFTGLIAGTIVMLLGLIFASPLATALGATETIRPHAESYMRFVLLGTPFIMCSFILNNQLRFQGNPVFGMAGMVAGALLNIALDPLLMFTCGMGVAGAALATSISQMVGFSILLIGIRLSGSMPIRLKDFKPSLSLYGEIVNGGLPSLCRQGLASVSMICLNRAAGVYGDSAIAAFSLVNRVMHFAFSAVIGLGQGFQPVCGFNYGAKLGERVRQAFFYTLKLSFCIMLALGAIGFAFAPHIIAFFRADDQAVIDIGARVMRWQCAVFPLVSITALSSMMTQTMGRAWEATLLALTRSGLFMIPLVYLLPLVLGQMGIEIAQAMADALSVLIAVPITLRVLRELKASGSKESPATPDKG